MVLKQKKKANRKIICGRGYCTCQNKKYVQGRGIMNISTPVMKDIETVESIPESIPEPIDNVVKINDSAKTIAKEILNKDHLKNIVDKINRIKMGSGFSYV